MATNEIFSFKLTDDSSKRLKNFVDTFGIQASKGPVKDGVKGGTSLFRGIARIAVPNNSGKGTGRGARSLGYTVRKTKGDPLGYVGVVGVQKGARSMKRYTARLAKRKKIRGEARGTRGKQKRLRATMTPTYLRYLEGGWAQAVGKGRTGKRHIAARPWMAPAFRANTSRILSVFGDRMAAGFPAAADKALKGQR